MKNVRGVRYSSFRCHFEWTKNATKIKTNSKEKHLIKVLYRTKIVPYRTNYWNGGDAIILKNREGGFLISKVKQISGRIFDKKLKVYDITDLNSAQGRIIFVLWKKDNQSISDLVTNTALSKTTLSSMLNRLEQAGHIKRALDKNDKRKTIISLTEKSKLLKGKYEDVSNEMINLFYKGLSEKQIDEFEQTLQHILNNLVSFGEEQK